MGNAFNKPRRVEPDDEEELEQQIVPTDSLNFTSPEGPSRLFQPFAARDEPPAVKPATNISVPTLRPARCIFILRRGSVRLLPVSAADAQAGQKFSLSFEYDAEEACSVVFNFGQTHLGLTDGVPKFSKPKHATEGFALHIGRGLKFTLTHAELAGLRGVTLDSCSFTKERKFVPILITVTSQISDFAFYAMCGLKKDPSDAWNIFVTKRRIRVGDCGYQLQEVYGLTESEFGQGPEGADERVKKCAICLEAPSNTILMPCRHLCLCSECSVSLSLQTGLCPICRAAVSQIIHISEKPANVSD